MMKSLLPTRGTLRGLERHRLLALRRQPLRRIATGAAAAVRQQHHETASYTAHSLPETAQSISSITDTDKDRREAVRQAKPFSHFLTDNFNRQHDYLRISVTERCNLRCLYCMPEEGVPLSPQAHLLTTPEIFYLSQLFVSQGVTKIRLTGGEPTIRPDIVPLMQQIGGLRSMGLKELALTTNGITLHRKLDKMVEAGLTGLNISLDTLDPFQFQILTRRKGFDAVMKSIDRVLDMNKLGAGIKLKINCVVMRGLNDREIIPFVELGREKDIEVRFIEYMPFDGNKWSEKKMLPYSDMLDIIRQKYPDVRKVKGHFNDTSKTYEVPGFVGKLGFITSMTHNFCGSCNRLRITGDGNLKVCLFGNAEVSLRDIMRKDNDNQPIDQAAFEAIKELEMLRRQGLTSDPGSPRWIDREDELLNVIGVAVKRKKEKHAGMGELENMKNRPMILIADGKTSFVTRTSRPLATTTIRPSHKAPWSAIPSYLLQPGTTSMSRPMAYSTDSKSDNVPVSQAAIIDSSQGDKGNGTGTFKESTAREDVAPPTSMFQSLASLFPNLRRPVESPREIERPREEAEPPREETSMLWENMYQPPRKKVEPPHEDRLQPRKRLEQSRGEMVGEMHRPMKGIEQARDTREQPQFSMPKRTEPSGKEMKQTTYSPKDTPSSTKFQPVSGNAIAEDNGDSLQAKPSVTRHAGFKLKYHEVVRPTTEKGPHEVEKPTTMTGPRKPRWIDTLTTENVPRKTQRTVTQGPGVEPAPPSFRLPGSIEDARAYLASTLPARSSVRFVQTQGEPMRPFSRGGENTQAEPLKSLGLKEEEKKQAEPRQPPGRRAENKQTESQQSTGGRREEKQTDLKQSTNRRGRYSSSIISEFENTDDVHVENEDTTSETVRQQSPGQAAARGVANDRQQDANQPSLTHVDSSGQAHMVDVGDKQATKRTAIAMGQVTFGNAETVRLILDNSNKKGDVLGVARVAGIMAAKRCSDLIPLCHPIPISKVTVDLYVITPEENMTWQGGRPMDRGGVVIEATVQCTGVTGVEMEALTAVSGAALTVFDMCKAVDRQMEIGGIKVISKTGGKSGAWDAGEEGARWLPKWQKFKERYDLGASN